MTGSGVRPLDRPCGEQGKRPTAKAFKLAERDINMSEQKQNRASCRSSTSGLSPQSLVRSLPARPTGKTGSPPSSGSRKPSGRKCWRATETAKWPGRAKRFRSGEGSTSASGRREGRGNLALLFFAPKAFLSRAGEMHRDGISPAPAPEFAQRLRSVPRASPRPGFVKLFGLRSIELVRTGVTASAHQAVRPLEPRTFESVYGAAGSVVLILVWVYYSSQLFFLGAEFTKVYARTRAHKGADRQRG